MTSPPDERLALAVNRRERGAFERLVEQYEKPLFNYVQRLVQNAHDAQEVVQDTFLRAHKALTRQYRADRAGELALRPWLFRIARNLSLNNLRARPPGERESAPDPQPVTVLSDLERKQELERLDRAIARLPGEQRELVVLRFIEEMSYAEIARTVGGSKAALRGKVFRALKMLRASLDSEENDHAV